MNNINQRIAALTPEQRKLLELKLKQKNNGISKFQRTDSKTPCLSVNQEKFWIFQQLQPQSALYNECNLVEITGNLDIAILEKSLNEIIKRHDVLRTRFKEVEGKPIPETVSDLTLSLKLIDLQTIAESDQEIQVQQLINEQSRQPFDLTELPLIRAVLIQLNSQKFRLLLITHHIVFDGWSCRVFYQELAELYLAFSQGQPSPLPPLTIQYTDFAHWQKNRLNNLGILPELNYWKEQLKNAPPLINLPTDYPRPSQQKFLGSRIPFCFHKPLLDALKALSQQQNATLFMVLLAAFKTLLYRYTGQTDLLVGTPVANRTHREIENLLGCFVNPLVLRTQLSGEISFQDLINRVRETALAAFNHENLPFEHLIKELQPERTLSYTPLFQVMFVFQNSSRLTVQLPNLTLTPVRVDNGTAKFDLTLYVEDTQQELTGFLEYNTELFKAETINRILGHFQTLIEGIIANPQQRLGELPLLTKVERHQLLKTWNQTFLDYPQDRAIHQLFEAQVEKTPDAVAVVWENEQLTYQQLNKKANQLADFLQQLGAKPETLVGVCLERSLDLVIGLLAILKAGAAYLPLDPAYPSDRLAFMVEDSQAPLLLTQSHFVDTLSSVKTRLICFDQECEILQNYRTENLKNTAESDNLAYLIYTSGSTGRPKGVAIEHRNTVAFISWAREVFSDAELAGVLASTSICFDLSVFELFVPLSWGGQVILAQNALALPSLPAADQVTLINTVPSAIAELFRTNSIPNSVKTINLAGEPLSLQLVQQLYEKKTIERIYNLYGPSEDTTYSTYALINRGDTRITIGHPIANTQIYILDQQLQPVPIGVTGEIYIGGAGLARGYFNQPELTGGKFLSRILTDDTDDTDVVDGLTSESRLLGMLADDKDDTDLVNGWNSDSRLYKTGDLGRYLPDGNIEFLGRIDHQIKLRGFRIELGEIEAALQQHSHVHQGVVIVREDVPGNPRLVAYLVAEATSVEELRAHLRQKLPEYMIPNAFVFLDSLPLTPNGKVNRRALPAPDTTGELTSAFVAPRDGVETTLTQIWQEVLGVEGIGIQDNFFELGGHSLLATQVISRIRQTLAADLSLQCLFSLPTIAELAVDVQNASKAEISAIQPVPRHGNLPLSFAQARLWLLEQLNPGSTLYNMPAVVHLAGELNIEALEHSLKIIIERHEVLRTGFHWVDGQPVQQIFESVPFQIPIINVSKNEIERLKAEEFQRPFDLTQPPLLRCILLKLSQQEHLLLFTIHHIVFDGWSLGVLIREFVTLYTAFVAGETAFLPELPIQYADFAVWQRQQLQGKRREQLLDYWKQQLVNLPVLQLPTTRPRAEVKTNRGATYRFLIPVTIAENLQLLSQQQGVTLFMTLLATFNILLQRYSQQDDIIVGTDVANRKPTEIEPLIGFFINLLVLRTDLSGNPTFIELLERVKTQTLAAYAHQDFPFDELVRELQPERHLSDTVPLFQVLFVLQNTPNSALTLPKITLKLLEVDAQTTRFDLALFLTETEEGLNGYWQYNADLFTAETIIQLTNHWQTLINNILSKPHHKINTLEMMTEAEKTQKIMQQQERKTTKRQKFMKVVPKVVNLSTSQLIRTDYLNSEPKFPLVIQPNNPEVDLISWAENHRDYLETELFKHGAILFRGFGVKTALEFEQFAQSINPNLFAEYGDLPRTGEGGKVYGSTPYPADKAILFHNESSHLHSFPLKIWFYCVQPAMEGGETPIVDCRKAYQILSPQLREKLATKQLMYVRNFAEGLDVSWQNFFQTTDKKTVEEHCRQGGIEFEWYDTDGLVTRQIRPALAVHPKTGDPVFFNQIQLHHISYLDPEVRESLLSIFGESKLPRNVYFGDGTAITDSEIAEINAIYEQTKISFPWQKGDIIMLDNMLAAHSRNPYKGQRKIVVAMAEMITR